jgi:carboxyl-terminal processing protease
VPDIVVEDATFSPLDHAFNLREADLSNHLVNPKEIEAPKVITPPATPTPTLPKDDGKEQKEPVDKAAPIEPGSKSDYQFTQAMNLLKGLQILQKK